MTRESRVKPSVAILGTRGYPSFYGGFETAVRYLAPYFAEHGWDVTVYGRPGAQDDNGDPRVHVKNTAGLESKSLSTLTYGFTSAVATAARRPDVALIMNCANGYFLPILKLAGVPSVVNVDGIEWERDKWGRLAKAVFHLGAKLTARWADEIVVDSHAIGDYWREHFGREGVYIPYGGEPREELPVPLGLPHRGYVLMVARFVPENTVPEFFEAVPNIAEHYPVVIVGSSGYGGPLDNRAAELDRDYANVQWLGHVKDNDLLHALWQHCGVYFHGHTVGGTNPALVQAMALGAPVVAVDTVYSREVLGDDGIVVKPMPLEIGLGIVKFLETSDDSVSSSLVQKAAVFYTWKLVCIAYLDLVKSLKDLVG